MVIFATLVLIALVISAIAYPFIIKPEEQPVRQASKPGNTRKGAADKEGIENQILARRKNRGSFCPQCGAPEQKNNKFCSQCGSDLLH